MKEILNSFFDLKEKISSSLLSTISSRSKAIKKPRKIKVCKSHNTFTLDEALDDPLDDPLDEALDEEVREKSKNLEFLLQRIKVLEGKVEILSSPAKAELQSPKVSKQVPFVEAPVNTILKRQDVKQVYRKSETMNSLFKELKKHKKFNKNTGKSH
jgi:hypothetical protein